MRKSVLLLLSFLPFGVFPQYQITIQATVIDEETKNPIPFANVEFQNTPLNRVTDEDGAFRLSFNEYTIDEDDIFEVSAFGYQAQDISAERFYKFLTNTNRIYLRQKDGIDRTQNPDKIRSTPKQMKSLFGTVRVQNIPVQGAKVSIKNSFQETRTGTNGAYALDAKAGDILKVRFLGTVTREIEVKSLGELNIDLVSDGELLDEVYLSGRNEEKPKVDLGYNGKKTFDEITYSANIIGQDAVKSNYYQLSDLLRGRMAKLAYNRNASFFLQTDLIYDIDGMIFSSLGGVQLPFIDPQIIESVTVLNSLTATHKYGTIGRAGVIVIRTKNMGFDKPLQEKPKALVEGNNYRESVILIEGSHNSEIGKFLKKANTFEAAKSIFADYMGQIVQPGVDLYFNASDYFRRWDLDHSVSLLEKAGELGYNNSKALRGLAFKYDELGLHKKAKEVYQRIAVLSPMEAQTYMDLARTYKYNGNFQQALDLLKMMMSNKRAGVDFTGLRNSIENEIKHILAFHRGKVKYDDLPNDLRTADFKYDVRVVFEWNDPYAEFELQFVNPGKQFFTWNYKKQHNTQRMMDGITNGFAFEEFIIDDAPQGEWIINLKAKKEEEDINPTFFKYTVYTDYGLQTETQETRVIQLADQSEKVTIDRLKYE